MTAVDGNARCRQRCLTHATWLARALREGRYLNDVWRWPGFVFESITLDWMHMADLGTTMVILGNVLFECFQELGGLVTRPADGLARLVVFIADAAHQIGQEAPFNKMTLGMLMGQRPETEAEAQSGTRAAHGAYHPSTS